VAVKRPDLLGGEDLNNLHKAFDLLECYAAKVGSWLPTFRDSLSVPYSLTA
jgi:hypothetical protein